MTSDRRTKSAIADSPIAAANVHVTQKGTERLVPTKYTSRAMTERRQRIIDKAHDMLADGGIQEMTIARLSREANVAPRTIYRLFNDKDGLIFATVADRMSEVREAISKKQREYTLEAVFEELDWMVSEMERDTEFARVVIEFNFSLMPRKAELQELRSVAYNRFRNWLDLEIVKGHTRHDLDLERITQRHVVTEFLVYRRWAIGATDSTEARLELRCCFLQTAALVLTGDAQEEALCKLAELHRELGMSEIGAAASTNRSERDAGKAFEGKAET